MLPLGPTGYGDSPYQCFSAFAGNPMLISLPALVDQGLLAFKDVDDLPNFSAEQVEFERVNEFKQQKLRRAFKEFKAAGTEGDKRKFEGSKRERVAGWRIMRSSVR